MVVLVRPGEGGMVVQRFLEKVDVVVWCWGMVVGWGFLGKGNGGWVVVHGLLVKGNGGQLAVSGQGCCWSVVVVHGGRLGVSGEG